MFLQYFADDTQLAAVVFWTFGDVGRVNWLELEIMTGVVLLAVIFFVANCWNYNAIDAGDETAKSLGVNVEKIRLIGMVIASLVRSDRCFSWRYRVRRFDLSAHGQKGYRGRSEIPDTWLHPAWRNSPSGLRHWQT